MTPGEAAVQIEQIVSAEVRKVKTGVNMRLPRAANALRNGELTVLSGNPSPSPPGSPPGRVSGILRNTWKTHWAEGDTAKFGITSGAPYAGYLEKGTHNKDGTVRMEARPFVDKIQQTALPEIRSIFEEVG